MASDFTPSSIKKSGGGGGVEGGLDLHPTPPLEISTENLDDKIVVEDIHAEPMSENFQGEEEMPEMNDDAVLEEVPPIEQIPEPESEIEIPMLDGGDIPEESIESVFNSDVDIKTQLNSKVDNDIVEQIEPLHPVVKSQIVKKKNKSLDDPQEYTSIFFKMWNGFFDLFEFKSRREKAFTKGFVSVAVIISLISMFHVQSLFALVNALWLSWVIAFAIELAVIVSLFSLKMLDRVSSWMIWLLIFILFFLQAVGNTFSAFIALDMGNALISQLVDMINIFGVAKDSIWLKRVIAFMVGGVLPLLAFLFIKSISEYLDNSEEDEYFEEDDVE
jgi:hypothetical protein